MERHWDKICLNIQEKFNQKEKIDAHLLWREKVITLNASSQVQIEIIHIEVKVVRVWLKLFKPFFNFDF